MKNDRNFQNMEIGRSLWTFTKKIPLVMRLFIFYLFCSIGMLQAVETYAQNARLSLNVEEETVANVLRQIEDASDFDFFYNNSHVDLNRRVSVSAQNSDIFAILKEIFEGTEVRYTVLDKKIILSTQLEASPQGVQQEGNVVKGKVVDANGEPVIGATIKEVGTDNGTVTDVDGNFTIKTQADATLEVSFIGYQSQTLKAVTGKELAITLKEDTEMLDEVVVVGFGSQKKANLTGAVTTVKMNDVMGERPLAKAADALQGAVPGLLVGNNGNSPGQSRSFQIRGAYSIGSASTIVPLVLIDNVEGDIDMLNPDDIESVTVMKDAASSAIYGARAAGGVILVTTKRPKSDERFQLNYNNNFAFSNAVNLPEYAPLETYLNAYSEAAGNDFWTYGAPKVDRWLELLEQYKQNPSSIETKGDGIFKDTDGALYYLNEKNLMKNMMETSFQHTHNLSVSGGTERLRYRLSAGIVDTDGVLFSDKDKYRRMNVSSFISADITKWFTQEATLSYAHSKRQMIQSLGAGLYNTGMGSFYPEGSMPEGYGQGDDDNLLFFTPRNQIITANPYTNLNDNPRIFLKSILKPLKGLEVVFEYTYDKNIYDYHWYTGKTYLTTIQGGADATPAQDYLQKNKRYTDYNAINVYGTYNFDLFKDHHFKVMAGFNQESSYQEAVEVYSYNQAVIEVPSLGGGTGTLTAKDTYSEYAIRGGFFRVNYDYMGKYLLEVNGRYDGSSKFPKDSRFGFFPSVSVGWNIAQENFMESVSDWLNQLKIRGSYGVIGNQNISPYAFVSSMSLNNKYMGWLIDGQPVTAVTSLPSLISTSFTWEKVGTTNIGLDFSFLDGRLSGLFEWYQKNTTGMLAPGMQLPAVVGASAPTQNTADMRTRGWELSMNWRDRIGEVSYRVGFNLSDSKSLITKYDSNESKLLSTYYEGQELGELWGYLFDGFYTVEDFVDTQTWQLKDGVVRINGTNPRPGDVKFKNLRDDEQGENLIYSGDGTLENPGDRVRIGNNLPRYLYGINLGATFKGVDLSVFLQGTGKRDAWIANVLTFPMYSEYKYNPLYKGTENYWRPMDEAAGDYTCANPDAEFPRIYGGYGNMSSNYRQSDKYLSDASYLRIKNVTLSYSFPKHWIQKAQLSQLKAFVSIENLATFSSLNKGIDPETLSWNYPSFRTVSFGLNVTL